MEEQLIEINVDEKSISTSFNPETSFAEVMSQAHLQAASEGKSVTGVSINGDDITGRDWAKYAHLKAQDLKRIDFRTGTISDLTGDLISSLNDFLTGLLKELEVTSEKLRLGQTLEANERLERALDGIQISGHTTEMIERNVDFDTREGQIQGMPITDSLKRIEPILEDMLSAQTQEDWILLADLLEYELMPYFRDRLEILKMWQEKVNA